MATAVASIPIFDGHSSILGRLRSFFAPCDLAMDLGTANTLIYLSGFGIVVNEPSMVAIEDASGRPLAVGTDAKRMFGKTSQSIRCVRPMKDGVIADFAISTLMITHMLKRVYSGWSIRRPRIVVGVPPEITQVEKRAVIDAALASGCGSVMLVEEPMAAALGLELPIDKAVGNVVVDVGGGTTDVAVISMNATVYSHSIRVAGDEMDEAIQRAIQRRFGVLVGIFEAERIKLLIGSAAPFGQPRSVVAFGRDLATGRPTQIELSDEFIRNALEEPIAAIVSSISTALEQTGPEIAHDISARGIYLAGGGSLLKGLPQRLEHETGVRFIRAHDPLSCVVRGVGRIVENAKTLRSLCIAD